jgi:hypothetical protein
MFDACVDDSASTNSPDPAARSYADQQGTPLVGDLSTGNRHAAEELRAFFRGICKPMSGMDFGREKSVSGFPDALFGSVLEWQVPVTSHPADCHPDSCCGEWSRLP